MSRETTTGDRGRFAQIDEWWQNSPLNFVRIGIIIFAFIVAFMAAGFTVNYPDVLFLVFNVLVVNFILYGILLLGLNLQYGYAGLVNFGPVLFFALGAYTMALVTAESSFTELGANMAWPVGIVAVLIVVTVVAFILGLSTIQLRDDYLAIVTLAAAEIFHRLLTGLPSVFGGTVGIPGVPSVLASLTSDPATSAFGAFVAFGALLLIAYGIIDRLGESPFGRVLRGIRDDEKAIESLGKSVFSYKFQTFIIGSLLMGFAGALLAMNVGAISPGYVTIQVTIIVWVGMLIGGAGSNRAVLGGLAIITGFQLLTQFGNQVVPVDAATWASFRLILIGLLMVIIIRFRPQGIWGDAEKMEIET
jgi:branched-chain amino acid transport system permease protein